MNTTFEFSAVTARLTDGIRGEASAHRGRRWKRRAAVVLTGRHAKPTRLLLGGEANMADKYPSLRNHVIKILKSTECQRIALGHAGQKIDGFGYAFVAHAVQLGSMPGRGVNIDVNPALAAGDAEAMYLNDSNTLVFPHAHYGAYMPGKPLEPVILERGAIVHECTHALLDGLAGRSRAVSVLDNETASYIAQWLYISYEAEKLMTAEMKRRGMSMGTTVKIVPPRAKRDIHEQAEIVAENIRDRPGVVVPDDRELASLKTKIFTDPSYAHILAAPGAPYSHPGITL